MQDVICQTRLRASTLGARTINIGTALRGKARSDGNLSTDSSGHGKQRTTAQASTAPLQTGQRDDCGARDDALVLPAVDPTPQAIGTSTAVLQFISSKASVTSSSGVVTSSANCKKARSIQSGANVTSAACGLSTVSTPRTPPEPDAHCAQQDFAGNGRNSTTTSTSTSTSSSTTTTTMPTKRVTFARGPLFCEDSRVHLSSDGHPASEGTQAMPVRRVPTSFALDLTKGNVLMLENLLGQDCSMSIARLKRRVGLLPAIRAPRPHVNAVPANLDGNSSGSQQQEPAGISTPPTQS
eukprot:gene9229-9394_t